MHQCPNIGEVVRSCWPPALHRIQVGSSFSDMHRSVSSHWPACVTTPRMHLNGQGVGCSSDPLVCLRGRRNDFLCSHHWAAIHLWTASQNRLSRKLDRVRIRPFPFAVTVSQFLSIVIASRNDTELAAAMIWGQHQEHDDSHQRGDQ